MELRKLNIMCFGLKESTEENVDIRNEAEKADLSHIISLNTATRPRGHFRQVSAASVSIRQEKIKYRQRIKSMIVKDKNR